MGKKLYCVKATDEYIRKNLKMSVRSEIHEGYLNTTIEEILEKAKQRAILAGKKTILKEHL